MTTAEQEKQKYQQVWSNPDYRNWSPGEACVYHQPVKELLAQSRVRTVLDVGCGTGRGMVVLYNRGFDVSGFDIAENCLDPSVSFFKVQYGCLWDGNLPKADAVYCMDVMEHIPPDKVSISLLAIHEAVKIGAFFGICLKPDSFGPKIIGEPLHLSVFSYQQWLDLLMVYGFKVTYFAVDNAGSTEPAWLYCYGLKT